MAATTITRTSATASSVSAAPQRPIAAEAPKPKIDVKATIGPAPTTAAAAKPPTVATFRPPIFATPKLPTPAFAVFRHRSELNRKRLHFFKVSQTKIHLTDHLIHKLRQRNGKCSYQDHQFMVREMGFRNFLHHQLVHRHMQLNAAIKMKKVPKLKRLQ